MKRCLVPPAVAAAAMLLAGVAAHAQSRHVTGNGAAAAHCLDSGTSVECNGKIETTGRKHPCRGRACPGPSQIAWGGRIVFVSARDGNNEIYSVRWDGTHLRRLTNHPGSDEEPVWSPDGTRIAFSSDRGGSRAIYVMNADGTNVVRRTFSGGYTGHPSWSPDGTKIAYSTLMSDSIDLWLVHPESGRPKPLFAIPGYEVHAAWSPDGSLLAFVSDWYWYDFPSDVFLITAEGSGFLGLTADPFVYYVRPSWAPNGGRLAVTIMQEVEIDTYITSLGVMNLNAAVGDIDGLPPIHSLVPAADWTKSSWSPDGRRIAYTATGEDGVRNIAWVTADGSDSGTIIANGWDPDWRR